MIFSKNDFFRFLLNGWANYKIKVIKGSKKVEGGGRRLYLIKKKLKVS